MNLYGCGLQLNPIDKIILGIRISFKKRTMLVAERFLQQELVRKYGKHPVSTDGSGTWCLSSGL